MTFFNSVLYNNIYISFALVSTNFFFLNSIPSKYKIILNFFFFLILSTCNVLSVPYFSKSYIWNICKKLLLIPCYFYIFNFPNFNIIFQHFYYVLLFLLLKYISYISKNIYYVITIILYVFIINIEKTIHSHHITIILLYFLFFYI